MANSRNLYPAPETNLLRSVTLKFRLQYAANVKADFVVPAGAISSNTRSNEGIYTMTLNQAFPTFVGGTGTVMPLAATYATAAGHFVSIDPADYVASTGVLTYRTGWTDGGAGAAMVPADIADNDWVYFELTFMYYSGQAPTGAIT